MKAKHGLLIITLLAVLNATTAVYFGAAPWTQGFTLAAFGFLSGLTFAAYANDTFL